MRGRRCTCRWCGARGLPRRWTFEVTVDVAGERQHTWLFVLHLMYSGLDFAWLYERCNQVAFLDGHVRVEHLGVAQRCIYDNLQAA